MRICAQDALDANKNMDDKRIDGIKITCIPPNVERTDLRQIRDDVWNDAKYVRLETPRYT